jgi:ferrous iron transport protein B
LVAKENIVATISILFGFAEDGSEGYAGLISQIPALGAVSFLIFNLVCPPCFAAIGTIKKELGKTKKFVFALIYQLGLAYALAFIIYNLASIGVGTIFSIILLGGLLYLIVRPLLTDKKINFLL